jgi:hypothetical protein
MTRYVARRYKQTRCQIPLAHSASVSYSSVPRNAATSTTKQRSEEDGVDELDETLDNLASLLQRTQRFVKTKAAIFKNQQSISVGV